MSPAPGSATTGGIEPVRKLPRLQKTLTFLLPDGWKGEVVDLSAVGMRLRCLVALSPNTIVEGALVVSDTETISLKAEVVWTSPPDHENFVRAEVGVELLDVPERYLKALAGFFADT